MATECIYGVCVRVCACVCACVRARMYVRAGGWMDGWMFVCGCMGMFHECNQLEFNIIYVGSLFIRLAYWGCDSVSFCFRFKTKVESFI